MRPKNMIVLYMYKKTRRFFMCFVIILVESLASRLFSTPVAVPICIGHLEIVTTLCVFEHQAIKVFMRFISTKLLPHFFF